MHVVFGIITFREQQSSNIFYGQKLRSITYRIMHNAFLVFTKFFVFKLSALKCVLD